MDSIVKSVIDKFTQRAEFGKKKYGVETEGYQIYAYPSDRFIQSSSGNGINGKSSRIVYAGGIIPYEIAISRGYENHVFDDLIDVAEKKTFDLTIYVINLFGSLTNILLLGVLF